MKRFFYWIGLISALGFVAYFVNFIGKSFSWSGVAALADGRSILAILVAGCIYVLVIPFSGWAWSRLLADMGEYWHWGKTAAVIGLAQIAKYVPGNVAQHVSRAALVLSRKMPADIFAGSVLLETLLTMAAAFLMGCLGWFLARDSAFTESHVLGQTLGLALMVLGLAVPLFAVFFRLLRHLRGRSAWIRKWVSEGLRLPGLWGICQALMAYTLNFLILGLGLFLVCAALVPAVQLDYFFLTAAFAFAWLAGFLAPGLPAGLGAREGVLSIFLAGYIPEAELLNVLLGMRLATVGGDILSFALGVVLARYHLRQVEKHQA
ncbi:MAG: lysylphosphatidylglycerol synthase domain-containing protein [Comamonas sp.]